MDDYGNNAMSIEAVRKALLHLVGPERELAIFEAARKIATELAQNDPRTEFGWQLFQILNKIVDDINLGAGAGEK